jgi:hypothetical protein
MTPLLRPAAAKSSQKAGRSAAMPQKSIRLTPNKA